MGKFTPLSEIEKGLDGGGETDYDSDSSIVLPPVKSKKSILKEPPRIEPMNTTREERSGGAVRDIILCAVAFVLVSNPFTVKKLLGVNVLASTSIIESDELKEVVTKNLNWKGFGTQLIGFLIILVVLKLLAYFGIC